MKLTRKQLEQQVREALKKRTLNENEPPAGEESGAGSSLFGDGNTFLGMEPDEVATDMGTPDATFNVQGLGQEQGEFFTGTTEPNPAGGGSSGFVRTFDDRDLAAQAPAGNLNQRARAARRSGELVSYDELPISTSAYRTDPETGDIRVTRGKFRGARVDPATMPGNVAPTVRVTPQAQARRDAARRIAHGSYQTQQGSGRINEDNEDDYMSQKTFPAFSALPGEQKLPGESIVDPQTGATWSTGNIGGIEQWIGGEGNTDEEKAQWERERTSDASDEALYPTSPAKVEDSKPRRTSLADKIMNPDPLGHLQERREAMQRRRSRVSLPPKTPAMQAIYERAAMGDHRLRFMFEHAVAGNAKAQQFLNALAETLTKSQILKEQEAAPEPPHDSGPPKTDEGLNIDALVEELESVDEGIGAWAMNKAGLISDEDYANLTAEWGRQRAAKRTLGTSGSDIKLGTGRKSQMDQIDWNPKRKDELNESQDPLKRMRDLALKSYGSYKYED